MAIHLIWFRNDLRLTDNLALHAACQDPQAIVMAVFIATPAQWVAHDMAPRQAAFLLQNLQLLQDALGARGIPLHYHQCDDFKASIIWLNDFCQQQHVDALFYNQQYELNERVRDEALTTLLSQRAIACHGFHDSVLLPPGTVLTGNNEMYKVFTPFRRAFIQRLMMSDCRSVPAPKARATAVVPPAQPLAPFDYPQQPVDNQLFPAGEEAALQRLRRFCREDAPDYQQQRDFPAVAGTSCLSPYLALGILSPRQCVNRLRAECPEVLENADGGAFIWLNELIWREFYRHLLVAYPRLCQHHPFITWTDAVIWNHSEQQLIAWQQGRTGYPIVDAAMRQLNATGWMHNRLRMISASFLVKDLLIDWRHGERYFMSQLLDGDLAANNGGWQWAASTGTDAAPYFRIFNPTTQGERFDKDGAFIRRWLPELAAVPDSDIHQPWRWAERQQQPLDYPPPLVDHKQARLATLAAFEAAKRDGSKDP
ncbi:FAD binding domain of DNA photolyase family protein [Yersinia rochesterensis]|uniref:Deoxyribodipyrimidine photo-lyase n=1 Tax=Yersinia rochesterensis TaxID=1604335 RepID=A0A386HC76_9GAMM|nr:deoxyribodipyrimidine photo-lyase [Yersinia rochesterensis]AJI87790.1 FAD binding domain of DNA photolyase family protein [Yersinia frederiksenii Y225]CNG97260.1 deoxyribodipyrimidine photolyase [Yersinia kristensenii]AIN18844.1 FAD binding domain of DNA photolyase family protein [Yersinia rochesterensis]AJJ35513.1 FAD binding domain of DNA photolyase family protein [Yersinia rochesterensis]AYD43428.1 deoxyribodipyrimidine photo-lyase [Yersinia rochesterensis]